MSLGAVSCVVLAAFSPPSAGVSFPGSEASATISRDSGGASSVDPVVSCAVSLVESAGLLTVSESLASAALLTDAVSFADSVASGEFFSVSSAFLSVVSVAVPFADSVESGLLSTFSALVSFADSVVSGGVVLVASTASSPTSAAVSFMGSALSCPVSFADPASSSVLSSRPF